MSWVFQDARFGLRTISRDRGFFVTAVLALALGIGATTTIFSVIDNIVLHPFPYRDGNHLYAIDIHDSASANAIGREGFSIPEFLDYQQQNHVFADSFGVIEETVLLGGSAAPEAFDGDRLTANAFEILGVKALLGRGLLPDDARPGAPPVFVLNYRVWRQRFGMDRHIVGKTFLLNDRPTTLVGVMPPRFSWWAGDLWLPTSLDRSDSALAHRYVALYGHLKPGLSKQAAEADLAILAHWFAKIYPQDYPKQFDVHLESLGHIARETIEGTLYTLVAAVCLLLLIACANVANLLLAKATGRERELAVRMALGAGRWRIVRQFLVESMLLAFSGAALGCVFAWAGLQGLLAILPIYTFPDEAVVSLNNEVLLATVAIAIFAALLFGLAPAMLAARRDLNDPLKAASRGNTGFRRGRLRNALIVSEVALSLLLLTGSGLLMRSFFLARQINLGIRTDHLLTTGVSLPTQRYPTADAQARFLGELLPRLQNLPGVVSAAGALNSPPRGGRDTEFDIAGVTHAQRWRGKMTPCSSQFFETLRLRTVAGRLLTPFDESGKRRVAVINQTLAGKYFGHQDPIGRLIQISALPAGPGFEIVGVVSDTKNDRARHPVLPEAFVPYTLASFGGYNIFVRTAGNPAALTAALEGEILKMDRNVIPQGTFTLDYILEISEYARPRFGMILLSVFAGVGLVLVTVGVYSVISYTVAQQRHEIGIRMVLGATGADVRSLVLRSVLRLIFLGAGAGVLLTLLAGRVLASQIWGVTWYDPLTLCGVILVLMAAGLTAAYVPSVRATRVDPAISLRCE